jgi:COMPASS component SWD2
VTADQSTLNLFDTSTGKKIKTLLLKSK